MTSSQEVWRLAAVPVRELTQVAAAASRSVFTVCRTPGGARR